MRHVLLSGLIKYSLDSVETIWNSSGESRIALSADVQ